MDRPDLPGAIEAIVRRRTARRYDPDRPVADPVLRRALALATRAPSARNLQPWRFILVRSPRNRTRLRACTFGRAELADAPVAIIALAYLHPERTHASAMVEQLLSLGAIPPEVAAEALARASRRVDDPGLWAVRSAMLAVGTLLLAAEALGLAASAILDGYDSNKIRAAFGVPDDHEIAGVIAIGYGLGELPPDPGRFPIDEVCYEEHFGQPRPLDPPNAAD